MQSSSYPRAVRRKTPEISAVSPVEARPSSAQKLHNSLGGVVNGILAELTGRRHPFMGQSIDIVTCITRTIDAPRHCWACRGYGSTAGESPSTNDADHQLNRGLKKSAGWATASPGTTTGFVHQTRAFSMVTESKRPVLPQFIEMKARPGGGPGTQTIRPLSSPVNQPISFHPGSQLFISFSIGPHNVS
jgi:hypothetical protein